MKKHHHTDNRLYGMTKEQILGDDDYGCYRRVKRKLIARLRTHRDYLIKTTNIYSGDSMHRLKEVEDAIKFWERM
jgi:hypothetical protein